MMGRTPLFLAGALLLAGGCPPSSGQMPEDQDMTANGMDLAGPAQETTIRDLNMGKVQSDTNVRVTGVVISPFTWVETSQDRTSCRYNLYIAQADQSPTLFDGMHVVFSRRETATTDMGLNVARCQDAARDLPIYTVEAGRKVEITGRFDVSPMGYRQIFVPGGTGVKDLGPGDPVQPAAASPKDFVNGNMMAFRDHKAALVRLSDVKVSESQNMFPFGFKVASQDNPMKATISTNYVRVRVMNYMPPPNDRELSSVTGIVLPDFGGTLWIRTEQDVVPK